ncbi:hypothetical protein G5714_008596 [Onychostoma macrolepis]|uniref:Ubiquitin-like domain-containing protein n=1 Tax=Onychostoma macrolepis TaxID=369639 RepID=A0A7J6CY62_9TELE|nr:hypothetical protein G5714_008596 [Onychostoma macrolepis]
MDILAYFTPLVENIISWWTSSSSTPANSSTANQSQTEPSKSSNKNDIPVTNPPQTRVSEVQEGSSPVQTTVNSHSGHYDHPHMPPQYSNSFSDPDEISKINIIVKCAGKTMEVDMFPLESISVLLKEACDRAGKKPEKMSLVYEGKWLDVNKPTEIYNSRSALSVRIGLF